MTTQPSQILSLVLCLMIPVALGVILVMVVATLRRTRPGHRRSRPADARSGLPDQGISTPTHRSGEGPLCDDAGPTDLDLAEEEAPPAVELPYLRRHYLLTQAERDFFAVLRAAAPTGWYVFPQIRLANLVMLKKGTRNWKPHFSRVAQKCVDFVLCDGDEIGPRLVVELDDSSHDLPDRQARDHFVDAALRAAGLPILHVRWQRRYDADHLARQIAAAAGLSETPCLAGAPAPAELAAPIRSVGAGSMPQAVPAPVQRWACRSCGGEVPGAAKHCGHCGARLEL